MRKGMFGVLVLAVVFFAGSAFADQIGDCTTTMKDGKTVKTKIYTKGTKTLVEMDSPQGKTKTINDGANVLIVMDTQKMCMKSPTPAAETITPGKAEAANPDGSTTKCIWTNAANADSMFALTCPAGYAMMGR